MSKYVIIILSIFLIVGYVYHRNILSQYETQLRNIDKENKEKLIKLRDSLHNQINNLTEVYQTRFDSIANAPTKIKYIKYEKPVYIYRTIDSAIIIISNYTYQTTER